MDKFGYKFGNKIEHIRKDLGISQLKLAELMSISRSAVSQIENGQRKVTAEELRKLAEIFNISVDILLDLEKEPEVILEERKEVVRMKPQMRINVPQKNLNKFKEVLVYILNKVGSKPNFGETVLYKIFYFIDFNFYEKYEEQLVGATYIKNKYGPTPKEFRKIVDTMIKAKDIRKIKDEYFTYPQTKYLSRREPDLSILKGNEIEMIDEVLNKLSGMNAAQISEYSHKDVPWLTSDEGKVIEYESVFYRTPEYSVRKYDEDI